MIYVDNVQQYMRALQRKFVMIHIGPNLIILYPSLKNIIIDKIYALCNSKFLKDYNTTLLLLECTYSSHKTSKF